MENEILNDDLQTTFNEDTLEELVEDGEIENVEEVVDNENEDIKA